MRTVAVGGVFGYVLALILFNTLGREWGCLILGVTFGAAWAGHSDRSRWLVTLLFEAIERHMSLKEAAIIMGLPASSLSRWRSGEEQASLSRIAALPDAVLEDWQSTYLTERRFAVVPSGRLADMTQAVRALTAAMEQHGSASTFPRQEVA
jgi:hypothetical protein